MRIACLQFDPQVGEVDDNLTKADAILDSTAFDNLDLLVLPELAFSGYNFRSLDHISPFLEEQKTGVSSLWARSTALKHDCTVIVGYPESVAQEPGDSAADGVETCYNSAIIYDGEGDAVGNYRKTHLYYTDETWALEGHGFFQGHLAGQGMATLGICMDINPYKFEAPWDDFEFARHAVTAGAQLVILSMAWLTNDDPNDFTATPSRPDSETLLYWIARLEPLSRLDPDKEVIVVFANRCGTEDNATYAGTSAVIGMKPGQINVYGIIGRGDKDLLVVDTDAKPVAVLSRDPARVDASAAGGQADQNHRDGGNEDQTDPHHALPKQAGAPPAPPTQAPGKTSISEPSTHHRDSDPRSCPLWFSEDQYMLQRYLDFDLPFSTSTKMPAQASIENSLRHLELTNATCKSMSSKALPLTAMEDRRAPRAGAALQDGEAKLSHRSLANEEMDRVSVRSDVSVWNNLPGRVPHIISPIAPTPHAQHHAAKQSTRNRLSLIKMGSRPYMSLLGRQNITSPTGR